VNVAVAPRPIIVALFELLRIAPIDAASVSVMRRGKRLIDPEPALVETALKPVTLVDAALVHRMTTNGEIAFIRPVLMVGVAVVVAPQSGSLSSVRPIRM
jgi:hypothetical protein